jgi:hypothetical protein
MHGFRCILYAVFARDGIERLTGVCNLVGTCVWNCSFCDVQSCRVFCSLFIVRLNMEKEGPVYQILH